MELASDNQEVITCQTPHDLNPETKDYYNCFLQLLSAHPTCDFDDLSALNSINLYGGVSEDWEDYDWNDEDTIKPVYDVLMA